MHLVLANPKHVACLRAYLQLLVFEAVDAAVHPDLAHLRCRH